MGGGLRPFRNNSLRSPLQNILNPGMCGSSDALTVELTYCRRLRGTLSKALLKSMMNISVCEVLLDRSWKRERSRVSHDNKFESRVDVRREFFSNLGVA